MFIFKDDPLCGWWKGSCPAWMDYVLALSAHRLVHGLYNTTPHSLIIFYRHWVKRKSCWVLEWCPQKRNVRLGDSVTTDLQMTVFSVTRCVRSPLLEYLVFYNQRNHLQLVRVENVSIPLHRNFCLNQLKLFQR